MRAPKRRILIVGVAVAVLLAGGYSYRRYDRRREAQAQEAARQAEESQAAAVREHYDCSVITQRVTGLYCWDGTGFSLAGSAGKGVRLELDDLTISGKTRYFPLAEPAGYYISYRDVAPAGDTPAEFIDRRYRQLVPFDYNVVTGAETALYDADGNIYLSFAEAVTLPLIVNDDEHYGVDYQDRLLWIPKESASLEASRNSEAATAAAVRTLCYHKLYDSRATSCNTVICHELGQLRSHLDYLKGSGYYFMSMQDMDWWLDGKIRLPYNSVCLTFDDGGANTALLVSLLNEYQIPATLFLIGSKYYPEMRSDYLDLQSHTYDLHYFGECDLLERGSAFVCRSEAEVLADLAKSREQTDAIAFCYPYYEFTPERVELVKKAGFKLAFGDDYGLTSQESDRFRLSRFTCVYNTTVAQMAYRLHHD